MPSIPRDFIHLGKGNGFPFCGKYDVTDADDYITLGGTRRGNTPTQSEIDLSIFYASKIYWLMYGFSLSAGGDGASVYSDYDASWTADSSWEPNSATESGSQPQKRGCRGKDQYTHTNFMSPLVYNNWSESVGFRYPSRYGVFLGSNGYSNSSIGESHTQGRIKPRVYSLIDDGKFVGMGASFEGMFGRWNDYWQSYYEPSNQIDCSVRIESVFIERRPFTDYYPSPYGNQPFNGTYSLNVLSSPFPIFSISQAVCQAYLVADDDYWRAAGFTTEWDPDFSTSDWTLSVGNGTAGISGNSQNTGSDTDNEHRAFAEVYLSSFDLTYWT